MAHKLLPGIPAFHFPVHGDYVTVKNAKYLIISNSSFACFPAFTSETAQKIIAPKYWARHNVSDGYWASEQNIYSGFEYLDRNGELFCAETCREELAAYRRNSMDFAKKHEKPEGFRQKLYEAVGKRAHGFVLRREGGAEPAEKDFRKTVTGLKIISMSLKRGTKHKWGCLKR